MSSSILSVFVQEIDTRTFLPTLLNPRTTSPTPKTLQQNRKPPVFFHPKFPNHPVLPPSCCKHFKVKCPMRSKRKPSTPRFLKNARCGGFRRHNSKRLTKTNLLGGFNQPICKKIMLLRQLWDHHETPGSSGWTINNNNLRCHHPGFYTTFGGLYLPPQHAFLKSDPGSGES